MGNKQSSKAPKDNTNPSSLEYTKEESGIYEQEVQIVKSPKEFKNTNAKKTLVMQSD